MANIFKAKTLVGRTGLFSHEVIAPNFVYNTGNQTISGIKTFYSRPTVNGTGVLLSGEAAALPTTIVYTTGNQTIEGVKDFNNTINVSGIKFDILTTTQIPAHQEGLLYYSDDNKTLNLDLDVANLKVLLGQENIVRAKNLTNSTMSPGTVVYISGAQGNTPLVQKSIATEDSKSARTLGVAAHSVTNNSKGYFTTFGLVEGINTSAYSVGQTLYLSHEVSGGLTGVKPQAPNHIVRIGNVIDQGANGSIFVDVQNGFEINELHDVRINNEQNQDGIVYNSSSGLWLNSPIVLNTIFTGYSGYANNTFATITNLASTGSILNNKINSLSGYINSPASNIVFTTGNQTINGVKIFTTGIDIYSGTSPQSLRIFNSTGTNSGEFGLFGWRNNQFIIGPQQTQSGVLRDLTLTGANININASGVVNIFNDTNIIGSLAIYSGRNPQSLRVFNSTGINSGEYGIFGWRNNELIIGAERTTSGIARSITITGQNIRMTPNKIFEVSNIDYLLLSGLSIVITGGGSINIFGGRPFVNGTGVLLSGEAAGPGGGGGGGVTGPVVMQTGNQNIGGNKTFTGITTFSGQEVNLIDTALNLSGVGDMTFTSTNINFINSPVYISGTNLRVSGDVLANNLVYNIGNQTIDGQKTFINSGIFNSGINLNNSKLINAVPEFINITSNFNITGTQNSRMILANSNTQITGTIVSGNVIGFNTSIIQIGAGQIQITGSGSNVIVSSYNNQFRTAGQFATISLLHTGNDRYIMYGNTSI